MGLLSHILARLYGYPKFEVGETYWNEDAGQYITIREINDRDLRVDYKASGYTTTADRSIYRRKLKDGVIRESK